MLRVGIREFKQRASELVRYVQETGQEVQITYHGTSVAMLSPYPSRHNSAGGDDAWLKLDELAVQIGSRWPKGLSSVQAIHEDRE
jgi:prevent-host-death family protein